jgi:NAD-dependent deacetylase
MPHAFDPDDGRQLAQARTWLAGAARVAVLTGAGMSAESGIATFRDALTGLWSRFDPEQLASEAGFRADPARVWDWYAERREGVRRAQPNAGHVALAQFSLRHPGRVTLVTQNVDDLHQRAGQPEVIRLHGDIQADQWFEPCPRGLGCDPAAARPGRPPQCRTCGNRVRPGVVWFGEMLPRGAIARAQAAAEACDCMLVVGTSGAVWPAAGLAGAARRAGARVIIVNPEASEIDREAHALVRGTAARHLPALLDGL